jgi:ribosomal-protein-alanine N-acetyltransferase
MTHWIETQRLYINVPTIVDMKHWHSLHSDPEVMQYLGGSRTRDISQAWLETDIAHYGKHGFCLGSVFEKSSGNFVGRAGLVYLNYDDSQPEIEIGYELSDSYWGRGYGSELVAALICWGFKHLDVAKLVAVTRPENQKSQHIMKKAGMRYEKLTQLHGEDYLFYVVHRNPVIKVETSRLILREWQEQDLKEFAGINEDPKVLEFLPAPLSIKETAAWIDRIKKHFIDHGFGLWAVEIKETDEFIGYVGLNVPSFDAHFTPCVEIGWRLASKHWAKGYATESAKKVLEFGFTELGLKEIVSFTVPANMRSIRVMEKIGMSRDLADDFYHPKLPSDHALALHVLYRKKHSD